MLKVGLTGNIGCGKSSISSILKEKYNLEIIDADLISREIYYDKELLNKVEEKFPGVVEDGILNRKALGKIVFEDKDKLKLLNQITHGTIRNTIKERIDDCKNQIVIVDAALMFEGGFDELVDKMVTVFCDDKIQLNRVMNRDSLSEVEARQRIDSQLPQKNKIERSDYTIDNSGSLKDLEKKVEELIEIFSIWIGENER